MSLTGRRDIPVSVRFEMHVDKDPLSGCWIWNGHCACGGARPTISVNGRQVKAHRYAYDVFVGPIPLGAYVCHKCDNTKCVNPKHLFVGSQDDNMKDMVRKGRANHPVGVMNGRAVLTEENVRFIRSHYKFRHPRYNQKCLAKMFGVCTLTIQEVLNGKKWSHVV